AGGLARVLEPAPLEHVGLEVALPDAAESAGRRVHDGKVAALEVGPRQGDDLPHGVEGRLEHAVWRRDDNRRGGPACRRNGAEDLRGGELAPYEEAPRCFSRPLPDALRLG